MTSQQSINKEGPYDKNEMDAIINGELADALSDTFSFYADFQPSPDLSRNEDQEDFVKKAALAVGEFKFLKLNTFETLLQAYELEEDWYKAAKKSEQYQIAMMVMDQPTTSKDIMKYNDLLANMRVLRQIIYQSFLECDAKWTFFVAALNHTYWEHLLSEKPPNLGYDIKSYKWLTSLRLIAKFTPEFSKIFHEWLVFENIEFKSCITLQLLFWVFSSERGVDLEKLTSQEFSEIMTALEVNAIVNKPSAGFWVDKGVMPYNNRIEAFKERRGGNSCFGFFAGRAATYWLLLQHGFQEFVKYVEYPCDAIILYKDFNEANSAAPLCVTWSNSVLGNRWRVVGICEYNANEMYVTEGETITGAKIVKIKNPFLIKLHCIVICGYHMSEEEGTLVPIKCDNLTLAQQMDVDDDEA